MNAHPAPAAPPVAPWPWPSAEDLNSTVIGIDPDDHLMVLDHRSGHVMRSFGRLSTWTTDALTRDEMDTLFPPTPLPQ